MTFDPSFYFTPENLPPSAVLLGAKFLSYDSDTTLIKFSWAPKPEFTNPSGNVQGGFITAILDDTFGPLVPIVSQGKSFAQSVDIHTHYLRPVPCEPLTSVGEMIKMGRRMAFVRASLYDGQGRECAVANASMIVGDVPKKYQSNSA